MLYVYEVLAVVQLAMLVYCVLNVVTTPEADVRNLPKLLWLLLVIVLPLVGGIAWLVAGRPQRPTRSLPYKGNTGTARPHRPTPSARPASPDDDEDFLRQLRQRAEEQRRRAREQDPPA